MYACVNVCTLSHDIPERLTSIAQQTSSIDGGGVEGGEDIIYCFE